MGKGGEKPLRARFPVRKGSGRLPSCQVGDTFSQDGNTAGVPGHCVRGDASKGREGVNVLRSRRTGAALNTTTSGKKAAYQETKTARGRVKKWLSDKGGGEW